MAIEAGIARRLRIGPAAPGTSGAASDVAVAPGVVAAPAPLDDAPLPAGGLPRIVPTATVLPLDGDGRITCPRDDARSPLTRCLACSELRAIVGAPTPGVACSAAGVPAVT